MSDAHTIIEAMEIAHVSAAMSVRVPAETVVAAAGHPEELKALDERLREFERRHPSMLTEPELLAAIHERFPGQPVAHGVDWRGPWARIGDIEARARPGVTAALKAALAKAVGEQP